jgi:hypothetical protein
MVHKINVDLRRKKFEEESISCRNIQKEISYIAVFPTYPFDNLFKSLVFKK